MGLRGPRPQPTVLQVLEGVHKSKINRAEPKPMQKKRVPPAPSYLPPLAKKEWKRIAPELHVLGLLTNLDKAALSGYCASYATWVHASKEIQKHGMLIKAQSGFPIQSPYVSIANKAMTEMRKWLTEFGMTPSSRSRIVVGTGKKYPGEELLTNGIEDFLD